MPVSFECSKCNIRTCASYFIHSISHVFAILLVKVLPNSNNHQENTYSIDAYAKLSTMPCEIYHIHFHLAQTTQRKTRSTDIFFPIHKPIDIDSSHVCHTKQIINSKLHINKMKLITIRIE